MITLYGHPLVPYTEKVRRALIYKGLDFAFREPTEVADYRGWSPKTGLLPAVDFDGENVSDSTDILYALDERYPDPPLLSSDTIVAGQQRQLEDWADESFIWYYMKYRRIADLGPLVLTPRSEDASVPEESVTDGRNRAGVLQRMLAWLRAGGTWERPLTGLLRELGDRLDDLMNFLGSRPFYYSDQLSMADLCVYAMLFTMRNDSIPGAGELVETRPTLVAFMDRVEQATGGATPQR